MPIVKKASIKQFAETLSKLARSDRYNLIGVGGFMGEGKSCFITQLVDEYSKLMKTPFSYDNNITWLREELLKWIDGEGEEKKGQMPEYSGIVADEFISMFYKRNWFKGEQTESIEKFNKIRDRHLLIAGAIPNFWDLDKGLLSNINFYVYIPTRGKAWIFEQENNPFSVDAWNVDENRKIFRKNKNPYKCPNFLVEIEFNDWTPEDKKKYYAIRNKKRVNTEGQNDKKDVSHSRAVKHRNDLIRYLVKHRLVTKQKLIEQTGLSKRYVDMVIRGEQ